MKFKANTRRRALEYEKDWVQRWKTDKTFEKSVENRSRDNVYVFYDGPPFISGNPHHGTLLSSIVKDAIPRYQTMRGKRVERVWGWDCHGLPAERYTEKKLGIGSREEVLSYGLEKYIVACRNNMVQTSGEWEDVVDRIGRWVDFKGAYKTMDKDYMESVWWAFKELYDKGKIYEGEKVLMYCTLDATPLSKAEVTMDTGAYQDITDPSVYVKFKLKDPIGYASADKLRLIKRQIVGGLLISADNKILLGENRQGGVYEGMLVVPGGGIDEGENELEALNREILEEVGVDISKAHVKKTKTPLSGKAVKTLRDSGERVIVDMDFNNYIVKLDQNSDDIRLKVEDDFGWAQWYSKDELVDKQFSPSTAEFLKEAGYLPANHLQTEDSCTYFLAWTTTPWTLPANTALAVNEKLTYVEVIQNGEHLILAKELLKKVMQDEKHQPLEYEVVRELKGKELVGLEYEPLFVDRGKNAHKVWHADYVSHEDGTGIVHLAPAYGEEDFELAQANKIPIVHTIDENGVFTEGNWQGENVWEINKQIAKDLYNGGHRASASDAAQGSTEQRNEASKSGGEVSSAGANAAMRREAQQVSSSDAEQAEPWRGSVWKIEYIRHSYPHCHRCGTRLMYRAHPSWFMDIDGQREKMLEENGPITWFPSHVKNGRFAKTIEQAPDWNLSRDRFWATAMPVWKSESGKVRVVGSYAELKELSGRELDDYHRPWVDDITFELGGETYTRIDKVMDCWFESGSMPFAQFHYPFENKEKFEANFPGDFIVEYVGQVRAWFYYVHAVNVALFGTHAFENVIVTGNVAGNDGRKMSKSYGNYTDPNELMDKFSADSLRFLLLSSPLLSGEDFALQDKEVGDVARKLSMVWNMYDFFTMYAEVDGWEYDGKLVDPLEGCTNPLDIWIISRLHQLVAEVERHMDGYNLPDAMSPILPFLDDASNWYVRRSRRRFWKSDEPDDKNDAYRTLHYVLVRLAYVLAPFTPFLAEELHHNLTGDKASIHLKDWLSAGAVNELVMNEMETVREYVNQGLSLRAKAGLKVRQPLASMSVPSTGQFIDFEAIIKDEMNVKEVKKATEVQIDQKITPELKREGLMREVVRHIQNARKNAGLNVDDRIVLTLTTSDKELQEAISEHHGTIDQETLAVKKAAPGTAAKHTEEVTVEKIPLTIALQKA